MFGRILKVSASLLFLGGWYAEATMMDSYPVGGSLPGECHGKISGPHVEVKTPLVKRETGKKTYTFEVTIIDGESDDESDSSIDSLKEDLQVGVQRMLEESLMAKKKQREREKAMHEEEEDMTDESEISAETLLKNLHYLVTQSVSHPEISKDDEIVYTVSSLVEKCKTDENEDVEYDDVVGEIKYLESNDGKDVLYKKLIGLIEEIKRK